MNSAIPHDPVAAVRPLIKNHTLLIVGGDCRNNEQARLLKELGPRGVGWAPTRERDASPKRFSKLILGSDFSLVVLLDGLIRHQHGYDVAALCKQANKPLIRLRRSVSPAAVSHAILTQASQRLGAFAIC